MDYLNQIRAQAGLPMVFEPVSEDVSFKRKIESALKTAQFKGEPEIAEDSFKGETRFYIHGHDPLEVDAVKAALRARGITVVQKRNKLYALTPQQALKEATDAHGNEIFSFNIADEGTAAKACIAIAKDGLTVDMEYFMDVFYFNFKDQKQLDKAVKTLKKQINLSGESDPAFQ